MNFINHLDHESIHEFSCKVQKLDCKDQVIHTLGEAILSQCPSIEDYRLWILQSMNECPSCKNKKAKPSYHDLALHLNAPHHDIENHYIPLKETTLGQYTKSHKTFQLKQTCLSSLELGFDLSHHWNEEHDFNGYPLHFRQKNFGYLIITGTNITHIDMAHLNLLIDVAINTIYTISIENEMAQLEERLKIENSLLKEAIQTHHNFSYIVGQSLELEEVLDKVEMVAPTDASVLITGESGTGKELLARAIHERSSRADKPLIKVNCASIPKDLFESEFFGHVKGAFTGAHRHREGRFQMANGGTLFLDEVGEIPIDLQSKLLRVLQEEQFEKVGDDQTQKVNVRIIAATNRDLAQNNEHFRQDLYYRLSVFPIHCPALRQRRGDIHSLVEYYLNEACQQFHKEPITLTHRQVQDLESYDWPGNIRELKNVVERAVITSKNGICRFEIPQLEQANKDTESILTQSQMLEFEKNNIINALKRTGGKVSGTEGAANLLGVSASTLASKIAKLNLKKEDLTR